MLGQLKTTIEEMPTRTKSALHHQISTIQENCNRGIKTGKEGKKKSSETWFIFLACIL